MSNLLDRRSLAVIFTLALDRGEARLNDTLTGCKGP